MVTAKQGTKAQTTARRQIKPQESPRVVQDLEKQPTELPKTGVLPDQNVSIEQAAAEAHEEIVVVNVPKAFIFTDSHHRTFQYKAGAGKMPLSHAEHWYSEAHGVTILED